MRDADRFACARFPSGAFLRPHQQVQSDDDGTTPSPIRGRGRVRRGRLTLLKSSRKSRRGSGLRKSSSSRERRQQGQTAWPVLETASTVDMAECSGLDNAASPLDGPCVCIVDLAVRIVGACDNEGGETEPAFGRVGESRRSGRKGVGFRIGNRDEECAGNGERRSTLPMGDQKASEAVSDGERGGWR